MSAMRELVRFENGLPSVDEAVQRLEDLSAQGDVESLGEVVAQAMAYAAYERRSGSKERADYYSKLKILAEAEIGEVDLQEYPQHVRHVRRPLLRLAGEPIAETQRWRWRMAAMAARRGFLLAALDALAGDPDRELTTAAVCQELNRRGVCHVPRAQICDWVERAASSDGISVSEIERRAGVSKGTLSRRGNRKRSNRVGYSLAERVAIVLDRDLCDLRVAPPSRKSGPKRRGRHVSRTPKLTGGRWDEAYVRLRAALDEFGRVAGENPKWDTAYAHFYALEESIVRQMKKDA